MLHETGAKASGEVIKPSHMSCHGCMQVAILCNHQRAVPKGHTGQMQKMEAKLLEHQEALDALQAELVASEKGRKHEGKNPRAADS